MITTVVSLIGTLAFSGACDDCVAAAREARVNIDPVRAAEGLAAALCPPRKLVMKKVDGHEYEDMLRDLQKLSKFDKDSKSLV